MCADVYVKEPQNLPRNYYLIAELLVFEYWWQNVCWRQSAQVAPDGTTRCSSM